MKNEQNGLGVVFGKQEGFFCEDDENHNLADLQQICKALADHCKVSPRRILLASIMGAYGIFEKNNDQIVKALKQLVEDQKQNLKFIQFNCEGVGDTMIEKVGNLMDLSEQEQGYKMFNFVAREFMKRQEEEDKDE